MHCTYFKQFQTKPLYNTNTHITHTTQFTFLVNSNIRITVRLRNTTQLVIQAHSQRRNMAKGVFSDPYYTHLMAFVCLVNLIEWDFII